MSRMYERHNIDKQEAYARISLENINDGVALCLVYSEKVILEITEKTCGSAHLCNITFTGKWGFPVTIREYVDPAEAHGGRYGHASYKLIPGVYNITPELERRHIAFKLTMEWHGVGYHY